MHMMEATTDQGASVKAVTCPLHVKRFNEALPSLEAYLELCDSQSIYADIPGSSP